MEAWRRHKKWRHLNPPHIYIYSDILVVVLPGVQADGLRLLNLRTGEPPNFDVFEGIRDLLIVIDGDKWGVAVSAQLSLKFAGLEGAGGAEVGLCGRVEFIALPSLGTVLLDGDMGVGIEERKYLVEESGHIISELNGDVILHH